MRGYMLPWMIRVEEAPRLTSTWFLKHLKQESGATSPDLGLTQVALLKYGVTSACKPDFPRPMPLGKIMA